MGPFITEPLTHVVHIRVLVLHEQTVCITATKLIWAVVILNGSKASGPSTNSKAVKLYSCWGQKRNPFKTSTYGEEGKKRARYTLLTTPLHHVWKTWMRDYKWAKTVIYEQGIPFSPVHEVILHLHQECTISQLDLTLKANKHTCMPRWRNELAKCFAVLKRHRLQSSLPLKMAA